VIYADPWTFCAKRSATAACKVRARSEGRRDGPIHHAHGWKAGVLVEREQRDGLVARNDIFRVFCDDAAKRYATESNPDWSPDARHWSQRFRENIKVARPCAHEVNGNGLIAAYIHTGAKVGVLVEVGAGKAETACKDEFKQLVSRYHVANCLRDILLLFRANKCPPKSSRRSGKSPRSPTVSRASRRRQWRKSSRVWKNFTRLTALWIKAS